MDKTNEALWQEYTQIGDLINFTDKDDERLQMLLETRSNIRKDILTHDKMVMDSFYNEAKIESDERVEKKRNILNMTKWGAGTLIGVVMAVMVMRFEEENIITGDTKRSVVRNVVDKLFRL